MKWAAIALVIASCARWEEIRVRDVRSGLVSIDGRALEVTTQTRSVELRAASLANGHLVGNTLDGAPVDISFDEVIRLRTPTRVQVGEAVLWVILVFVVIGALFFLALLSEIKPSK